MTVLTEEPPRPPRRNRRERVPRPIPLPLPVGGLEEPRAVLSAETKEIIDAARPPSLRAVTAKTVITDPLIRFDPTHQEVHSLGKPYYFTTMVEGKRCKTATFDRSRICLALNCPSDEAAQIALDTTIRYWMRFSGILEETSPQQFPVPMEVTSRIYVADLRKRINLECFGVASGYTRADVRASLRKWKMLTFMNGNHREITTVVYASGTVLFTVHTPAFRVQETWNRLVPVLARFAIVDDGPQREAV